MARDYGKLVLRFWDDPHVRRLSHEAQRALIYFKTAPQSTAGGTYVLPLVMMAHHLTMPEDAVLKVLHELGKRPHVLWDRDASVLYQADWFADNRPENPNVAAGMAKALIGLPDCEYKARAIEDLRACGRFAVAVNNVIGDWRLPEGTRAPDLFGTLNMKPPAPPAPSEPQAAEPPAAEPGKRATRITVDWQPTDEMRAYARGKGLNEPDITREVTKFVRYWTGPDANTPAKKDWLRTWQNWIDKAAEHLPKVNGANGHSNGHHADFQEKIVNGFKVYGDQALYKTGLDDAKWIPRSEAWHEKGFWHPSFGPEPGQPGCKCPAELLVPRE